MKSKVVLLMFFLTSTGLINAANVAYTGAGAPGDIADAANWGGSLPGTDDVGVIDVASYGNDFVLSSDVSFGGLSFSGNSSLVTVESTHMLTVGGGGIVAGSNGGLTLKLPLAVSAASTWDFGGGPTKFYGTISGTSGLKITNTKGLWHYVAPRYSGKISYSSNAEWNNSSYGKPTRINFYEANAPWADSIGVWKFGLFFNGETSFATLFPGMNRIYDWWTVWMGKVGDEGGASGAGMPTLTIGSGENIFLDTLINGGGTVLQNGGSIKFDNANESLVLGNMHMYDYVWNAPCRYYLNDGVLKAKTVRLGDRGMGEISFEQRDGSAAISRLLAIGCGDATDYTCLAGYVLGGGSLTVSGATAGDGGLVLGHAKGTAGSGRSFMRIDGGTADFDRVMFGGNESGDLDSVNTYGLFCLNGGTLNLGGGGIAMGSKWNPAASRAWDSSSLADVHLDAGTVTATADSFLSLPMQLAKPGKTLEIDVPYDKTMSVFAPVSGEGTLVKRGVGSLVLTDANDFKGSLDIREGKVRVMTGTVGGNAALGDCWQWTADSLSDAGVADGEAVSSWADVMHGVTAVNATLSGQQTPFSSPVLKKAIFNGHAALAFNSSMLQVSANQNPLVDAESLTIALVFRMDNEATASLTGHRFYTSNTHMMNGTDGTFNGGWAPWFNWVTGNRVQFTVDSGYYTADAHRVTSSKGSLKDMVHVCVATVDRNRIVLTTEGETIKIPWSGDFKNLYRRNGNSWSEALPIPIGAVSSEPGCNYTLAGMNIAELRLYTRALEDDERAGLASELSLKYNGSAELALSCWSGTDVALAGEASTRTVPDYGQVPTAFRTWTADAFVANDGAAVSSWCSVENQGDELSTSVGLNAPELVKNALNGHATVRFDALGRTALSMPTSSSAWLPDWNNWTIAVVFRTTQGATGLKGVTDGNGIVSIAKDDTVANSFQISMVTNGELKTVSSSTITACHRPMSLDDGRPHVALVTSDVYGRCYSWDSKRRRIINVDGVYDVVNLGQNPETGCRSGFSLNLGCIVGDNGLFSGEIAEVRIYSTSGTGSISIQQMNAVVKELSEKYAVRLHPQGDYGYGSELACGLGASTVRVAAGASLVLPAAAESPVTMRNGGCIHVCGSVSGTLALENGAKLKVDLSAVDSASIEKLIIPSGTITVEVAGASHALRNWQPLVACDTAVIGKQVKALVLGDGNGEAVFESRNGILGVKFSRGTILCFR